MEKARENYLSKFRPIIRVDAHYRKLYQEILDLLNEHYFKLKSQLY